MTLNDDLMNLVSDNFGFGLDFGTTNSLVAFKEGNTSPRIPAYGGNCRNGIPSLAWVTLTGRHWYCDQVENQQGLEENPEGVWVSGKMQLANEKVLLNGKPYKPRLLATEMVKHIIKISLDAMADEMIFVKPNKWVVGAPDRFTAAEHGEIQRIVQDATGIKEVRVVSESILSAITYTHFSKKIGRTPRRMLVIDIGGGTTDVVMLLPNNHPTAAKPEPFVALHPDGLRKAGDCCDQLLEDLILEKVRRNPGIANLKNLNNPNHYDRRSLRRIARDTKERLSAAEEVALKVSTETGNSPVFKISRSEYEALIRPMFTEIVNLAASVLERCQLGKNPDIDILLVGGTSYTPLLRKLLQEKFHWLGPDNIVQQFPEKAVALGAAIYAQTPELVRPKIAFGYGVNTFVGNSDTEMLRVIIPSEANLPMTVRANFSTRNDGQLAVKFSVYEVPSAPEGAHLKMEQGRITEYSITHKFAQRVPKDTPVTLHTTLTEDGVLQMTVEDFLPEKRQTPKTFYMNNTTSI